MTSDSEKWEWVDEDPFEKLLSRFDLRSQSAPVRLIPFSGERVHTHDGKTMIEPDLGCAKQSIRPAQDLSPLETARCVLVHFHESVTGFWQYLMAVPLRLRRARQLRIMNRTSPILRILHRAGRRSCNAAR